MIPLERELQTVRWGDRIVQTVGVGQIVRSAQLFSVSAPFPTTWRIICFAEVQNAANFGVSFNLSVGIGIGSSMKEYQFALAGVGAITSFEVPGQKLWAVIRSTAAIAADTWVLDASIAPMVPWRGIHIENMPLPTRQGIHGDEE
jgi:hypothetical protein